MLQCAWGHFLARKKFPISSSPPPGAQAPFCFLIALPPMLLFPLKANATRQGVTVYGGDLPKKPFPIGSNYLATELPAIPSLRNTVDFHVKLRIFAYSCTTVHFYVILCRIIPPIYHFRVSPSTISPSTIFTLPLLPFSRSPF